MNLAGWFRALSFLEREYADDDTRTIRERLLAYIDARTYRAEIVSDLPANAPAGKLMVTPSDPVGLYVGRGQANTLARVTLTPLP